MLRWPSRSSVTIRGSGTLPATAAASLSPIARSRNNVGIPLAQLPSLLDLVDLHPQAQVVGIDMQDSKAAAKAFYRRFGRRHPSIFDPNGDIAARFALQGLPATLFLARGHQVVARIFGETDLAGLTVGFRRTQT